MGDSGELENSWRITCAAVSVLHFKEGKREKDEQVIEKWSALKSGVHAVQGYFAGESTETLTMFQRKLGSRRCEISWFTFRNKKIEAM